MVAGQTRREVAVATAGANQGILWTDIEGCELSGGWRLVRLVRPEGRTAWFEASGPDGKPLMMSVTETLNDERELLVRLRAAHGVRHANVVAVYDARVVRINNVPMVVAAMERTEENLADVLRERALTAAEARQILEAVLAGLAAIHGQGLVHGRVEAASVLAMDDTIKLRSDCLHAGGEEFAAGVAEDLRGLGRVVCQSLTRRVPEGENDPVLQLVPEPLARVVRQALSGRASLEQIAAMAGVRVPGPQAAGGEAREAVKPDEAAGAAKVESGVGKGAEAVKKAAEPRRVAQAGNSERAVQDGGSDSVAPGTLRTGAGSRPEAVFVMPEAAGERTSGARVITMEGEPSETGIEKELPPGRSSLLEDDAPEHRSAPWIIVAAVTLVVITIFVLYGMMHDGAKKHGAEAASAAEAAAKRPLRVIVQKGDHAPAAVAAASAEDGKANWRVIVYTYDSRKDAQQKAAAMAKRYPKLHPGVMETQSAKHYLVVLGSPMVREAAEKLRAEAIRMGLPQDTYAQNIR